MNQHNSVPRLGIGIDTGGTFTDSVLVNMHSGQIINKAKTPTTHKQYHICIDEALRQLQLEDPHAINRICLSTTLATNAVAEDLLEPTCLVIEPADIKPTSIQHERLVSLNSGISYDLNEIAPVCRDEVLQKTAPYASAVVGFAVSGYAATRDPRHEQEIGAILEEAYGLPVVLGSTLTQQLNFIQRGQSALINAGLCSIITHWLAELEGILAKHQLSCPVYVVKSDGSLITSAEVVKNPVLTLFSGPAASIEGAVHLSAQTECLVVDIGGTTSDVARIRSGRAELSQNGTTIHNTRLALDGLKIHPFGLGGDSRLNFRGHFRFEKRRAMPFARARHFYSNLNLEALAALNEQIFHHGDNQLIELIVKAPYSTDDDALPSVFANPTAFYNLCPASERPKLLRQIDEWNARRLVERIALTPTDLAAIKGLLGSVGSNFNTDDAQAAMAIYARIFDLSPQELVSELSNTISKQLMSILISHLGHVKTEVDHLAQLALGLLEESPLRLELKSKLALVYVGAAANLWREWTPLPLREQVIVPQHAEVANAVGAILASFVARDKICLELASDGSVFAYAGQGKHSLADFNTAIAWSKQHLTQRLTQKAHDWRLLNHKIELAVDIREEYDGLSRKQHKRITYAEVEGCLMAKDRQA